MGSIIKFPESVAIGVHAMVYMAGKGQEPATIAEIADAFRVSGDHLAKVLAQLKRAGLADSVRGPSGGYVVARAGETISLFDVFAALQGPIEPHGCLFKVPSCERNGCPVGKHIMKLEEDFSEFLKGHSISSFSKIMNRPTEGVES